MVMKLDDVVPFGRSLAEYRDMFCLTAGDLDRQILAVADGPASFNAEMNEGGRRVISLDPLYRFSAGEIEDRFFAVLDTILSQVYSTPEDWVWTYHQSPDALKNTRIEVMQRFAADYEKGGSKGVTSREAFRS
jgi:hypothetical protein